MDTRGQVFCGWRQSVTKRFIEIIDSLSDRTGKGGSWIILALIGAMVLATFMRYAFNKSPFWAYDMAWMLYGAHFLLGGAYCHLHQGHVRVDLFSERLSPRPRAILEVVGYLVFFFPLFYVLVVSSIPYTYNTWVIGETSPSSSWAPILGPMKTLMVLGFLLLALQGLAQFLRVLPVAIRGHHER